MSSDVLLTSLSKGSGCGCKINPDSLKQLLQGFTMGSETPNLVVGNSMADDCSVMDLGNGQYLLQTVDFFTPIVNDPFIFGAAAAANALSDIWAMGGKLLMANAIFSWPLDKLSIATGREVLRGAMEICTKAGIPLAGGHSIDGQEALFGLSVTGTCLAENLKQNSGAKNGDLIILTRPVGSGMLAAAHKRGQSSTQQDSALFKHLVQLNKVGEQFGNMPQVHAITDVTGFGLVGHLLEICHASNLGAEVMATSIPKISEAESLAADFVLPDNAMRNWNAYEKFIELNNQVVFPWLVDPQTNGGLLLAVDAGCIDEIVALCPEATLIGKFTNSDEIKIKVI